jgi:hypothetical protein
LAVTTSHKADVTSSNLLSPFCVDILKKKKKRKGIASPSAFSEKSKGPLPSHHVRLLMKFQPPRIYVGQSHCYSTRQLRAYPSLCMQKNVLRGLCNETLPWQFLSKQYALRFRCQFLAFIFCSFSFNISSCIFSRMFGIRENGILGDFTGNHWFWNWNPSRSFTGIFPIHIRQAR